MSEFQEKVNGLVSKMEQTDDGKWNLPDDVAKGLDEPTLFAVTSERRRRDTQGAYTQSQQELRKQLAISTGLENRLLESEVILTKTQKFELNDLKKTDPEAWRAKLNEYEQAGKDTLKTELKEIAKSSSNKSELDVRTEQMAAWSESTGIELTDTVVDNDLPPRFKKELESGKITFEQFLTKAGNFLKAEKTIKGASDSTDDDTKDLSDVAGGSEPDTKAQEGDFSQSYEKTIF